MFDPDHPPLPRKLGGYEITVDGHRYWATTLFNLRNILYDLRNEVEAAAKSVEKQIANKDTHETRSC